MDKKDKDIRKDIEELEKLIDKVKKQNEEQKKKYTKKPNKRVVRINLASAYSNNFWVNFLISFLINFIVVFSMFKLFNFVHVTNDAYIAILVFSFTVIEEVYRRYLFAKQVKLVLFTSGLIFTLLNVVIIYIMDLLVFGDNLSFIDYTYPLAFVIIFQLTRGIIKNIIVQINARSMLKSVKRK